MKNVIVTTKHRGVFFGEAEDTIAATDTAIKLANAKMAVYWGTTRGLFELAHTGPTSKSRISAPADVELVDVTAVLEVSDRASEAWASA